jgi:hypothetical protein
MRRLLNGHVGGASAPDPAHARGSAVEALVQRLPRSREAEGKDGAERHQRSGHREHVRVDRIRHR